MSEDTVNVRYMVNDVDEAVVFYTSHFGFTLRSNAATHGRLGDNARLAS